MANWEDAIDSPRTEDLRMLKEVQEMVASWPDEDEERLSQKTRRMLWDFETRLRLNPRAVLTGPQREALRNVYEAVTGKPTYANEWSSGKVPRGREVETPAVLRHLPKKPPGRS